jgi:superfamily II DNA or RNA helicase
MTDYRSFLESKAIVVRPSGISVPADAVHPSRFGHQRDIIRWMLRKGRAACFAATGMGKAGIAVEACRLTGERALILAPLGVVPQFVDEGARLGVTVMPARDQSESPPTGITVANYDRLHRFDPAAFGCVALDESSCLKHEDAKIREKLVDGFRDTPFRFAFSATPAPNDHAELANHAEFLGVMERREVLATFFVHATKQGPDGKPIKAKKGQKATQEWRLKGHARDAFYRWLASWGMSLKRPSDLGYDDDGYLLPELSIRPVIVRTDWVRPGELFASELKGVQDRAAVRRATLEDRVRAAVELVRREPDEPWVLWCGLNDEQDALAEALGDRCASIDGRTPPDERIRLHAAWKAGERPYLVTKGLVFGHGMNWQHCARTAFVGLSDSYELYHQMLRRFWRFGQARPVHAYVVLTEPEEVVYANVLRKEREFEAMTDELVRHVAAFERDELAGIGRTEDLPHAQPTRLPAWLQGAA